MFCTNCGSKIVEGARFCVQCGAKIEVEHKTAGSVEARNPDGQSASHEAEKPETIQITAVFCGIAGTVFAAGSEAWFVPWKFAKFLHIFAWGFTAYPKIKSWRVRLNDVQYVQLIIGPFNCALALHLPNGIAQFVIGSKFKRLDAARAFKTALDGKVARQRRLGGIENERNDHE